MPKQTGIVKVKGTMGDISFYKTKDGNMAREKSGVSSKRFSTDPAFARTRENASEFTGPPKPVSSCVLPCTR